MKNLRLLLTAMLTVLTTWHICIKPGMAGLLLLAVTYLLAFTGLASGLANIIDMLREFYSRNVKQLHIL